jgi:hypothetical protein
MAQKRMFSKKITNSEEFLELPVTTQLLYFHLSMNADDDGFVQPTRIMRMIGHQSKDDLKLLHIKGFLLPVADRVIIIKHWHVNNTIRNDRHTPSMYKEHLKNLGLDDNKVYFPCNKENQQQIPNNDDLGSVNQMETQISIDQISKEEISTITGIAPNEDHKRLTKLLIDYILKDDERYYHLLPERYDRTFESWANSIRLLNERDKRTIKEIEDVIHWCKKDDFWKNNIMSGDKLRRQFSTLFTKSKNTTQPKQKTMHIGAGKSKW